MLDPNEEKPYLGENPGIGYCFFEDTDTRIEFNVRDINRYEEYGYLTIMAFEQLSAELDNIDIGLDKNAILTSLIGGLADILDHQIMVSISRDGLNSLKITNEVVTQNFIQAANQALQRIQKDFHTVIKNGFLSELDADSVRLTSISAGGGDFHKKNKQVMMLSFQDAAGNKKKVVYKPSSVMADAMIVGDVERLKTLTGDYKFQYSLLELLNMGSEGDNALPKYLIVPRSDDDPLEHLKSNRDIKINTDKDYGYVEFLPHNPWEEPDCVDMLNKLAREKGRKPTNEELQYEVNKFYSKLLRKAAENENCDYFTQDKDAEKNYSKACGRLLAILWVCGGIDMHCQNLIMSGKMPHLIDLEVCLSKLVHDLANTVSGDKSGALQGGSLDTIEVDYLYNDKLCEYTVQHPGKNILFSVEKQGDIDVIDNCSSDPKQVKKGFKE